jgi:hypothetical protein
LVKGSDPPKATNLRMSATNKDTIFTNLRLMECAPEREYLQNADFHPTIEPRRPAMDATKTLEKIDQRRRRLFGNAALAIAAAQLGMIGAADAQPSKTKPTQLPAIKPGSHTSFASLKQIDAGLLNVGYAEAGPADGSAVILLHGWPYDIHSFVDVAPMLASPGYRVIVPCVRGYGTTRFLSSDTVRNGQPSVVALDVIALMDALKTSGLVTAGSGR